jgi:hypothetical protein
MISKIRLWWKFDGQYLHKNFIQGVKNLIRWFPTIWKDRDWDQDFIYTILAKKLEFQANYIASRDWHTNSQRDAERIRLVAKLIAKHKADFYAMEYMDYATTNFWFEDIVDKPEYSEMKSEIIEERYDEFFAKYPRQYKKAISGELNRYVRSEIKLEDKQALAMEISHENRERCKRLLFTIMHDHIDRWWD